MSATATPKELQASQILDWLEKAEELGADLTPLSDVMKQLDIVKRVWQDTQMLRKQPKISARAAAAHRIASGGDYDADDVRAKAITAEEAESKLATYEEAAEIATRKAWTMFTRRKDANLELLRPAYLKAADDIVTTVSVLGQEKIDLDTAARRGQAAEWLLLEDAMERVQTIRRMHSQWLADKVVNHRGARSRKSEYDNEWDRYTMFEFYYGDRDIAEVADGEGLGPLHYTACKLAAVFRVCGAALRSIAEIDAKWPHSADSYREGSTLNAALGGKPTVWDGIRETARQKWAQSNSNGYVFQ